MNLIENWREELNKAWSVRIAILTSILASSDQILSAFIGTIPPLVYAGLAILIVIAKVAWQK